MTATETKRAVGQSGAIAGHAEQMLVACCIEKPEIIDGFRLGLFGDEYAKSVFQLLQAKRANDRTWEPYQFMSELARRDVSLMSVVNEWQNDLHSPENWPYWEEICREEAARRHAAMIGRELQEAGEGTLAPYVEKLKRVEDARTRVGASSIKDTILATVNALEDQYSSTDEIRGVRTGFPSVDAATNGLREKHLWVVAARPRIGKTTLACNMMLIAAVTHDVPVAMFSLEMSASEIGEKLIFAQAGVSQTGFKRRNLSTQDFNRMTLAAGVITQKPLHIVDSMSALSDIIAESRRLVRDKGVRLIFVDYLQRVQLKEERDRWVAIGRVSNALKDLAMELDVTVIAMAQLSRDVEKEDRDPTLADLKGSSEIEADANVIAFLHRAKSGLKLILGKVRAGYETAVDLNADYDTGRFTETNRTTID